jgi:hypothetical protein
MYSAELRAQTISICPELRLLTPCKKKLFGHFAARAFDVSTDLRIAASPEKPRNLSPSDNSACT